MSNFWQQLKKQKQPIMTMAPMAGITDSPFRQLCKRYGADVLYSEMASVSALTRGLKEKTLSMLRFEAGERPYVVQIFGSKPEEFKEAVKIIEREIKPDGIDINFGCPVPKVCRSGSGSQLFRDFKLSKKVIEATINASSVPVSIKVRTKVGESELLPFLDLISGLELSALMIHGRTFSQGFSGAIDYETIKKARNYFGGVILANGGIQSKKEYKQVLSDTEADGIGIGRAALGRPWIFQELLRPDSQPITQKEVFKIALEHAKMMVDFYGEKTGMFEMRKHLAWYVKGFEGASEMRQRLVRVKTIADIERGFKILHPKGIINFEF